MGKKIISDELATKNKHIPPKNGVKFTSQTAASAQLNSAKARKRNASLREAAAQTLRQIQGPALAQLTQHLDKCTPKEIMEILSFLAKYAGQEPSQKQDINLTEQTPKQFIFEVVKNAGKKV